MENFMIKYRPMTFFLYQIVIDSFKKAFAGYKQKISAKIAIPS